MSAPIELRRVRPPIDLDSSRTATFLTDDTPLRQAPAPPSPTTAYDIHDFFPTTLSLDEEALQSIHPEWKRNLFALVEQPTSSPSAFLIHMLSTFLIVASAVVTVLETVPTFHSISTRFWFGFETSLVALFTVEYVARCLAWSSSWSRLFRWMFSFFGIIDLLSVLPYYIEIILQQDTSTFFRFSILRMFRLLRVFRPFRYNHTILLTIEVMYLSVRRSQHALFAIGFFVVMILTVFSTLLYFAERGTWDDVLKTFINSDGDPTQFSSIPAAAWFVLVTITTVGYGEITPRSFLGRLVTLPILVFGLLLITLPSFVLGREFSLVWNLMISDRGRLEDPDGRGIEENRDRQTSPTRQLLVHPTPGTASLPSYSHPNGNVNSHMSTPQPDLSNLKLAQNQTELSRQIAELSERVEMQGVLVERLIELLEGRVNNGAGAEKMRSTGLEPLGVVNGIGSRSNIVNRSRVDLRKPDGDQ